MNKRERLCLSQIRLDARQAIDAVTVLFDAVDPEPVMADARHAVVELQADLERLNGLIRAHEVKPGSADSHDLKPGNADSAGPDVAETEK